ncbi:hypothetical protein [Streptomyces violascens]|uniref:hypothetical protein n=1 Tax=Streptomyces violascens TaxID=67381 RepID=UPI0036628DC4
MPTWKAEEAGVMVRARPALAMTEHWPSTSAASANAPLRQLADEPDAYDPYLDVDFSPIRSNGPPADGFGQAA